MDGNVTLVTEHGLRFISMDQVETQKLIKAVEELKQEQKINTKYRFMISFNDQPEVSCEDVWICIGVSRSSAY